MEYLSVAEIILLHARLIQQTGGSRGIRDVGLLESAVARPQATFERQDLYPDLWTKAAALMESLVQNHPFVDGNKRAGLVATGLFLARNGYTLIADNAQVLAFTMRVATGERDQATMARWLRDHSAPIQESD